MSEIRTKDRAAIWFLSILTAYYLFNVLQRVWLTPALSWDEAELMLDAQDLLLAYGQQPPLIIWLQFGIFQLFGPSVLGMALLKQGLLLTVVYFLYRSARELLIDQRQAVLAAIAILLLPQFVYEAQRDLSHTIAATACLSVMFYLWVLMLKRPTREIYLGIGLFAGLALLTKYNTVLFVAALVLATSLSAGLRQHVFHRWTGWAILVALLVSSPHYLLLFFRPDEALSNLDKLSAVGHGWGLSRMFIALSQLMNSMFGFIFVLLAVHGGWWLARRGAIHKDDQEGNEQSALYQGWLARLLVLVVTILSVFIVTVGAGIVKERWLLPLFFIASVYLFMRWPLRARLQQRGFFLTTLALLVASHLLLVGRVLWPELKGKPTRWNLPVQQIANQMKSVTKEPALILTDSHAMGGGLRPYFPGSEVYTAEIFERSLTNSFPILAVWQPDEDEEMPRDLSDAARIAITWARDANCQPRIQDIEVPYLYTETEISKTRVAVYDCG